MLATTTSQASAPHRRRAAGILSAAAASVLLLSACADAEAESGSAAGSGETITVEDDHGTHEIDLDSIESVGAFDNRSFRLLEDLGVELSVAPRGLMQPHVHETYAEDESILDTGNHREPDLEQLAAAQPDLVITGQRYSEYYDEMADLMPEDGVILEWDEGTSDPTTFFEGLREQVTNMGEIFQAEEEADELIAELDEALERVESAYNGEDTVMGLVTSGGDINYAGPNQGRGVAPLFQEFDLEPALEVDDESTDHEGDDISVEAIADSDPEWILVLDRDGMMPDDPEYTAADELIADSPALQQTSAIENDQIVYMPQNMYITEDIQAYTEFLNDFADALEEAE
ncbi:siderophore ABC transporter substrate-binding protein [Nesterenkonia lacusekhoensis]|uniref:Iron complex transport system substrate-binding protein n=1 Tax=Nesterenkonia lacusekhoensis TaxID=150832 RepID=A0ABS4T066_9MICC|nr:ABC transporter substrate-binding protein [Nesterenkonia lacusekhoensis]MBP2317243.1 iron complex transport system substrate-binding protein [Nesterenkonia lacusekhoensis]